MTRDLLKKTLDLMNAKMLDGPLINTVRTVKVKGCKIDGKVAEVYEIHPDDHTHSLPAEGLEFYALVIDMKNTRVATAAEVDRVVSWIASVSNTGAIVDKYKDYSDSSALKGYAKDLDRRGRQYRIQNVPKL